MEEYRVISAKKVSLCDIDEKQEQKHETSIQAEVEEIPSSPISFHAVEVSCSTAPNEVVEINCDSLSDEVVELLSDDDNNDNEVISCEEDKSLEILGFLTNNDSNAPNEPEVTVTYDNSVKLSFENGESNEIQQNFPSNNSFGSTTLQCDQDNSVHLGTLSTSDELYIDQNGHIQNEAIENCSEYYDNSVQLSLENNESTEVQENFPSNNSFGSTTPQCDQDNSDQLCTLGTSNELYIDQNGHIQNEALENCSEYFTIDFIASPNESNGAIDQNDASDAIECPEMPMCSETDDASENSDVPAIAFRRGKAKSNDSVEPYTSYLCPQCGIDCGPLAKWKLHTEAEHGFGLLETANVQSIVNKQGKICYKCRDCPRMFDLAKGFSALILHRITHMPFRDYIACRMCSAKYRMKTSLKRHLQREHKELNVITMPRFKDSALEHIRFFCSVCKEEQSNDLDWRAHMKEQHDYFNQARSKFEHVGNNFYKCSICELKVRATTLVFHIQTHEKFKSFTCTFCNVALSQLKAALSHVRTKHLCTPSELFWRCTLCKATFKSLRKRSKHYLMKHKIISQRCKVCKKTFVNSSSLLSHMSHANHYTLKSRT